MAYEHVLVDVEGDLGIVTLNRPARRNALSEAVIRELTAAFEQLAAEAPVRAIVLAANGPVFSAGHDLSEIAGRDLDGMRRLLGASANLMRTMQALPQPVVACVHAIATAGGCQLVASADLAVAADVARFATPGGREGWFCITPMIPVQRLLPPKRALEMLFTGDEIDAATALAWGLVNRVVPADRVRDEAKALARRASRGSLGAKALGKRMFYETVELPLEPAYEKAVEAMASSALTDDAREWIRAFLDKRPAVYSKKR
ncbi:MAG TPA: enoyl-CoA hydratase-related protein [Candidatus Eisenbacteria bacterium]|nr:enoyl-CoA hydratase-related protein [Candidatus Eisenbacteria bacterium]